MLHVLAFCSQSRILQAASLRDCAVLCPSGDTVASSFLLPSPQDLSAQLHLLREEQASVKEGESTSVGDTAKQTKEEVESLHSLLGERCKELEEARRRGDRRTEELAEAQERIKVPSLSIRWPWKAKFTASLAKPWYTSTERMCLLLTTAGVLLYYYKLTQHSIESVYKYCTGM